nr:MAG TPA: hypothetical protein [Caudoviricetes sp.]
MDFIENGDDARHPPLKSGGCGGVGSSSMTRT